MALESTFTDFYDKKLAEYDNIEYKRSRPKADARGLELNELRKIGIPTLEVKAVSLYNSSVEELVVYTEPHKHDKEGKIVTDLETARLMYRNNLASPFYRKCCMFTIKYVQVGKRRFRVFFLGKRDESVFEDGQVMKIEELYSQYNTVIKEPIFSIDYISTDFGLIAIDFNKVQNLGKIGLADYMTDDEVCQELLGHKHTKHGLGVMAYAK